MSHYMDVYSNLLAPTERRRPRMEIGNVIKMRTNEHDL